MHNPLLLIFKIKKKKNRVKLLVESSFAVFRFWEPKPTTSCRKNKNPYFREYHFPPPSFSAFRKLSAPNSPKPENRSDLKLWKSGNFAMEEGMDLPQVSCLFSVPL